MSKKRRVKLNLEEDEAAVIAPVEFWDHLREIYACFASDPLYSDNKEWWKNAEAHVAYWVAETKAREDDEEF